MARCTGLHFTYSCQWMKENKLFAAEIPKCGTSLESQYVSKEKKKKLISH